MTRKEAIKIFKSYSHLSKKFLGNYSESDIHKALRMAIESLETDEEEPKNLIDYLKRKVETHDLGETFVKNAVINAIREFYERKENVHEI